MTRLLDPQKCPPESPQQTTDPALVAEDPDAYSVLSRLDERLITPDAVLHLSSNPLPDFNGASRLRFGGDVGARVAEIRAWFAERERQAFMWSVGPHATPVDVERRLLDLGAVPNPIQPMSTAMVLDREPPEAPLGIEVRREASFEDYVARWELIIEVFGFGKEQADAVRAKYEENYAIAKKGPAWGYGAWIDGRLAGISLVSRTEAGALYLAGAATHRWARHRGVYRTLTRVRWDDAVRLGMSALVVQASPAARLVLQPLGFRSVGRIANLLDRST